MIQHYELLYIMPGSVTDEDVPAVKTKLQALLTSVGATIVSEEDVGRKKLAYRVGQHYQGVYELVHFDCDAAVTSLVHKQLQLAQEVLRFLITERDMESAESKAKRAKLRENYQAKRQEKMAKEVGRAMAKAQEARTQHAAAKEEVVAPAKAADEKDIQKELDKLMSDDVKV